jgi:hypothetical protein
MHLRRRLSDFPQPTKTLPPSLLGSHMTWPFGIVTRRTTYTIALLPTLRVAVLLKTIMMLTTPRNCPCATSLPQAHQWNHPSFNPIRNRITCPRPFCHRHFHSLFLTRPPHLRTLLFLQLCDIHCTPPLSRPRFLKVVSYPPVNIRQQYWPTTRPPAFYLANGISRNSTCSLLLPRIVPRVCSYSYGSHGRRDLTVPPPTQEIVDPTSPRLLRYRRPQKKQPAVEFEPDVSKDFSIGAGQQGRTRRRFVS